MTEQPRTVGLVLAGGLARRMGGGDKALIRIGGEAILDRVLAVLRGKCEPIILNANGDPTRFARYGLPVIADSVPDFAGPLAGILAGLDWAAAHAPGTEWVVSVPGDCPFLPTDLVDRLHAVRAEAGTPLACARSGDWRHPVVGLCRGSAQDRDLDRAARCRDCRVARSTDRSVLQREHPGRRRDGGSCCEATSKRVIFIDCLMI
jgi:molybdopterin-guanine dinucleotide biosynthesis protein A